MFLLFCIFLNLKYNKERGDKMETYNISSVNDLILTDIKQEAGLLSHSLNLSLSGEEIVKIAVGNVRKKT